MIEPAETAVNARDPFADVYERHFGAVVRVLRLGGANLAEAEDCTQEAFAITYARWARVSRGTNPAGYVFRVAFRLHARTRARDRRRDSTPHPTRVDAPVDHRLALSEAVGALPRRQRECVLLRYAVGLTTAEIAATLDLRESTVRSHLQAGRASLVRCLSDPP